jgi:hypothetical protein
MNGFRQDVAYGLRSLIGQRAFTLVAVVVLGSAIGLSTSVFTAFNAAAFRPWPVPDAGRVVKVFHTSARGAGGFSLAEARYLSQHARAFAGVVAVRDAEIKLEERGVGSEYVTGNFFATLRVPMQKGRHFLPEEDVLSDPRAVTILSGAAWQRLFAADPRIVGRSVRLNVIPFTVV